jgi:hypothetical protein
MRDLPAVFGLAAITLAAFLFILHSEYVSAATNHVVISQIEVGTTGSAADEFVELYNPTPNDVNLSSWRLSRKNSGGTLGNLTTNLSGTIKSHGYFLIGSPTYSGIPSLDLAYSTGNTIANNNTVILFSDAGITTIDLVGIGPNAPASESASTLTPVNNGSIQRKTDDTLGHGIDTNNNSVDFELLTVSTPRNSSIVLPPTPALTQIPTLTPTQTITTIPSLTSTPTISVSPTPTPINSPTPSPAGTIIANSPHLVCYLTKKQVDFFFFKIYMPFVVCVKT